MGACATHETLWPTEFLERRELQLIVEASVVIRTIYLKYLKYLKYDVSWPRLQMQELKELTAYREDRPPIVPLS